MEPKRNAVILQLLTEGDLSNKSNPQMRTKDYKKDMIMISLVDRLSKFKQIIVWEIIYSWEAHYNHKLSIFSLNICIGMHYRDQTCVFI